MVETVLHPIPCFQDFLRTDSRKEGDALSYYDYHRAMRAKKVEILQQKKAVTYEPGYRKPGAVHPAIASRKVLFQLKKKVPVLYTSLVAMPPKPCCGMESANSLREAANQQLHRSASIESICSVASVDALQPSLSKTDVRPSSATGRPSSATGRLTSAPLTLPASTTSSRADAMDGSPANHAQTERLPKIMREPRLIKSATARDHAVVSASETPLPVHRERPKTVASCRDSEMQTSLSHEAALKKSSSVVLANHHQRALSEGSNTGIRQAEREELCKSYQWGTTTQRAYDEVKRPEKFSLPSAFLPTTTVEQFPDPVSQKLTFRRYNSEPAGWQTFGTQWDYVQTRQCDDYVKGPQAIAFCSSSKKTQQIPGYSGYMSGLGIFEDKEVNITPMTLVRTTQPRKTKISRRANIPGYTGQVHWANSSPAHHNMPIPEPTSTARVHRYIPLEDELSPFRRDGVLSKTVTTVSPHNPYNKIQY